MRLSFDPFQEELRQNFRNFLKTAAPIARVRAFIDRDESADGTLWQGIADLGIAGMLVPEPFGGAGLGPFDQLVIQEEAGRHLTPAPLKVNGLASYLLGLAANKADFASVLQAIADGQSAVTLAWMEPDGNWAQPAATQVHRDGAGLLLTGVKVAVPFAQQCDHALVTAATEQGAAAGIGRCAALYLVPLSSPGVYSRRIKTLDGTQPWYELRFDQVRLETSSLLQDGERPLLAYGLELASLFTCAEMVGAMEQTLQVSTEYAKNRVQFDRPIGSFQAVKHKLADMVTAIEAAKSLTYYAAVEVAEHHPERLLSLTSARLLCSEAAYQCGRDAIQVHGGMGFTWETDPHLFLRRAMVNQVEFGDPVQHRRQLKEALLASL